MAELPPEPLPPLPDPCFDGKPGPYSVSPLRDVCGTRINPYAAEYYLNEREILTSPNSGVVTCVQPELAAWLGDVQSFDPYAKIHQPPLNEWPLSVIIPRIPVYGESLPFPLPEGPGTYMVDYHALASDRKKPPSRPWVPRLKERFPEESLLLLSFFAHNNDLAWGIWTQFGFWHLPFLDQFDGILIPDFTSYCNDPIPRSLQGERMQQIAGSEAASAGRLVIPSVAWRSEDSLRRQIELWASQYPRVNTIQLNCYGSGINRTLWIWRWLMAMEKYCTPFPHIRWVISGITAGWAIRELNRIFPEKNYHLITPSSTFIAATRGSVDPAFRAERFRAMIARYEDFWSGELVADPVPRPEVWPSFADVRLPANEEI